MGITLNEYLELVDLMLSDYGYEPLSSAAPEIMEVETGTLYSYTPYNNVTVNLTLDVTNMELVHIGTNSFDLTSDIALGLNINLIYASAFEAESTDLLTEQMGLTYFDAGTYSVNGNSVSYYMQITEEYSIFTAAAI